jgi:16S rRNA (cytidine1402-2'-O)-methyltransferase
VTEAGDERADIAVDAGASGADDGAVGATLWIVATPIGNLRDVTLRALDVLGAVPLIAAEDTRLSRRLLERHGIETRLISFHAQSGPGRLAELLAHLREGRDLALVTDAGTPAVSDPGDELVRAWAGEGGRVVPVPGPSAVMAAVAGSGIAGAQWTFEGFLPRKGRERRERLARIAADERGAVMFEAPGRVAATLADLVDVCGPHRPAAVCRELTKRHEEIVRHDLGGLAARLASGSIPERGEFVIVVGRREAAATGLGDALTEADRAAGRAEVERLVAQGVSRADAARRVAQATGLRRRDLYNAPADR